jgi:hypothetical protein
MPNKLPGKLPLPKTPQALLRLSSAHSPKLLPQLVSRRLLHGKECVEGQAGKFLAL